MISNDASPSFSERFHKIAKEKSLEESEEDFYKRNIAQNAARAAETYVGLPGNFKKAFQESKDYLLNLFPGFKDRPKAKELEEKSFGTPEKGSYEDLIMNPLTSSQLRETASKNIAEKSTGDENYLEPRGEVEKATGELTQDLTSFFLPGSGQLRMITKIGVPVLGNLGKQGLKYLGVDEKKAEQAKLGMMLVSTLASQSNPGQFASERISQSKNMIPETATVNAAPLARNLMPLLNRMQRGFQVPSKSRTMQGMGELAGQIQNGRLNMRSLMDARDGINEWIAEAGGWDIPVPTRNAAVANLNQLKTQIIDTIESNMATRFPQARELYETGYEAAAVTHQSNAISNFIEKNFGRKTASVGAKLLFPSLVGGSAILPKTAAAGILAYPVYKTGQVLYRVGNSPTLARYYQDVLTYSAAGNVPAMVKSMDKLDKALAEDEKKMKKGKKISLDEFKARFKQKG